MNLKILFIKWYQIHNSFFFVKSYASVLSPKMQKFIKKEKNLSNCRNIKMWDKKCLLNSICDFYEANWDNGKSFIVKNFQTLILDKKITRQGIYNILKKQNDRGTSDRAKGSGRPLKLSNKQQIEFRKRFLSDIFILPTL